jgi:hypothetical protein
VFRNQLPNLIMLVDANTGTTAIDLIDWRFQKANILLSISTDTTLSIVNYPWYQSEFYAELTIVVRQDATGGRVLTLPAEFVPTAVSPALSTAADSVCIIDAVSFDGGINWVYTVK